MNGDKATKIIKSHVEGKATVIIAVTASVLEEEKTLVLSAGCDDFVRKPFTEMLIFQMLAKHLGVRYVYKEAVTMHDTMNKEPLLTTQHFRVMPQAWITQLFEAAMEANAERVMRLIQDIPETEAFLAKSLTQKVQKFQFEQILDFIEPLIGDNSQ